MLANQLPVFLPAYCIWDEFLSVTQTALLRVYDHNLIHRYAGEYLVLALLGLSVVFKQWLAYLLTHLRGPSPSLGTRWLYKVRKSSLKCGWGFTVTFTLDLDLHTLGMLFFVCNYGSDVKLKPFLSHWYQFCFENKVIPSDPCYLFVSVYLFFIPFLNYFCSIHSF